MDAVIRRNHDDGNGHAGHAAGAVPGHGRWGAHVRYFLAQYPVESRDFVAQRLASYGIRSLLSANRQEDLTLEALVSATDAADREVLSLMREHARGRREQRGGRAAVSARRGRMVSPRRQQQQQQQRFNAKRGGSPARQEVLRERVLQAKTNSGLRTAATKAAGVASRKRHEVIGRPDVLTRYPFVDDHVATQGGGVGAAMHMAMPTTPIQYLAKREIRRLAHEAFRELKASALGIRLTDLPCALQFLFFGDSASLLTAKGGGAGDGGARGVGRSAKDVHLVMALARECLPPTLAHAARDTSTLSSASTHGGADAGWMRDGQNMFVSERRWIKVVAHVIRRLWDMDGTPQNFAAAAAASRARRPSTTAAATSHSPKPSGAAAAPFGLDFQQPPWRPTGGGRKRGGGAFYRDYRGGGGGGGGGGEPRLDHTESFLTGLTVATESRSDFASTGEWESAAGASRTTAGEDDGVDEENGFGVVGREEGGGGGEEDGALLRAWEEEGESWVGAGRSLAWAPGEEEGSERGGRRGASFDAAAPMPGGSGASRNQRLRGRHHGRRGGDGGGGGADENWKEGTRPAGMWEVTPPAHVVALRRGRRQGGSREGARWRDGGGGGPAYLRGVQSRIRPQLEAHKERLRKDVVARQRLGRLVGGDGARRSFSPDPPGARARGHTPGEHALEIAEAFLESPLMTRLAGGDWHGSEDGGQMSAGRISSAWETEEAVRVPARGGRRRQQGRAATGRKDRSGRKEGSGGRPAHTGWLGDFGPVHTHTVREAAGGDDDDDDADDEDGSDGEGEEEEDEGGSGGSGGNGRGGGGRGQGRGSGRGEADQQDSEGEEESGGNRRAEGKDLGSNSRSGEDGGGGGTGEEGDRGYGGPMSAGGISSAWETEEAARVPLPGGFRRQQGRAAAARNDRPGREEELPGGRPAQTGWLKGFSPVHTHAVREAADDDADDGSDGAEEEKEEEGGSGGGDSRGGEGGGGGIGEEGEGGYGDDGSGGEGEGGAVDESTRAVASVTTRGGEIGTGSVAAESLGSDVLMEEDGGGDDGDTDSEGQEASGDGNDNNGSLSTGETGDANAVAPLDGGLDAYLQLASDGQLLGGGGGVGGLGEGIVGEDGVSSAGGGGGMPGIGGGSPGAYTGATTGSWWEEDRSAMDGQVGEASSSSA